MDLLPLDAVVAIALALPSSADLHNFLRRTSQRLRNLVTPAARCSLLARWLYARHGATAAIVAAASGDVPLTRALLAMDSSEVGHAAVVAAADGKVLVVRDILLHHAEAIATHELRGALLIAACDAGSEPFARLLIGSGAAKDEVHVASMAPYSSNHAVGFMHGLKIMRTAGPLALIAAAAAGHDVVVEHLLAGGVPADGLASESLIWAAEGAHVTTAAHLLRCGASAWAQESECLIRAARQGCGLLVSMLLSAGAKASAQHSSALTCASQQGDVRVVSMLLQAGARADDMDSAALLAAAGQGHAAVVELLLDAGARPQAQGSMALTLASKRGHEECLELLLSACARDLDIRS